MNTRIDPFNGPIEIGLRVLILLTVAYPETFTLDRLVIYDYLLVHSDDVPDGPTALHPRTPYRAGEILVRRGVIQEGILLYQSRGLLRTIYDDNGLCFAATEKSAIFLDAFYLDYVDQLRNRANWLINHFGEMTDSELNGFVSDNRNTWGSEFTMESLMWSEIECLI